MRLAHAPRQHQSFGFAAPPGHETASLSRKARKVQHLRCLMRSAKIVFARSYTEYPTLHFRVFFVSVRRTVFVSVSAAEAAGFRRADLHGRCNSIKPLCGSASRKSRQRFAAFAAFVVAAKRPLSEAQNFNRPLFDFDSELRLKTSTTLQLQLTPTIIKA